MADLRQTMRSFFRDCTLEFHISKTDVERLTDAFYRMDRSEYVMLRHQVGAGASRWILEKTERRAVADYRRAVNDLFVDWRAVRAAFHQEIKDWDDDVAFQGLFDRLDALLQQAEILTVPDTAAAVHRVFIAMLRLERAYFQDIFDNVDDKEIGQYAAYFQEEATMFRAEFDRLLHGLF
jgi:hypothetical protein